MSISCHQNDNFFLSFKLRVISFCAKRAIFLLDETGADADLPLLANELWSYKEGILLLGLIPTVIMQFSESNA